MSYKYQLKSEIENIRNINYKEEKKILALLHEFT